jgi:hypothetical protein
VTVNRQWGSNWGKKQSKQTGQQAPPGTSTTTGNLSVRSACKQLAQAVQQEFLQRDIQGSCIPAATVFFEAVTAVGAADAQLELCYMRAFDNSYMRHMRVVAGGQQFDIAGDILRAAMTAEGLPAFTLTMEETMPPGARFLGWGASSEPLDDKAQQMAAQAEAGLMQQLKTAEGREQFWSGSPPKMQEARKQILALSSSLRGKINNP